MHEKRPKQIKALSEQVIKKDIEKYRQMALDMGASDAKMIPAEKVYVDFRVWAKCMIPRCPICGSSVNCPPHTPETEKIRELVSGFRYALLVKVDVDSPVIVAQPIIGKDGKAVMTKETKQLLKEYRKVSDIVTKIESQAFYDGHYLAVSFAGGSCRLHYCNFQECSVLKGMPCRFPLRARPSMEGSSMNVYRIVAEAGWDIFPIGMDCNPAYVPHGSLVGLVLVD
jgi:predicted metal-binding protein